MGALNTAGKVTFLPDDSPFSEYTDISGRAHAWEKGKDNYIDKQCWRHSTHVPAISLNSQLQEFILVR